MAPTPCMPKSALTRASRNRSSARVNTASLTTLLASVPCVPETDDVLCGVCGTIALRWCGGGHVRSASVRSDTRRARRTRRRRCICIRRPHSSPPRPNTWCATLPLFTPFHHARKGEPLRTGAGFLNGRNDSISLAYTP